MTRSAPIFKTRKSNFLKIKPDCFPGESKRRLGSNFVFKVRYPTKMITKNCNRGKKMRLSPVFLRHFGLIRSTDQIHPVCTRCTAKAHRVIPKRSSPNGQKRGWTTFRKAPCRLVSLNREKPECMLL